MKIFLLLFSLLLSQFIFAQNKVTDVSPDGKLENTYLPGEVSVQNLNNLSPYHSTPSWNFKRDRQIGGMAFGDYDNDGDLDLAVGCYSSNSYPPITEYENFILRNDNGILDTIPAWVTADEKSTAEVRWADINGDGLTDLVSANGSFHKTTIYFNSPSGLSTSPGWVSDDNVWTVGSAVTDVDGNGWPDLALANQGLGDPPATYRPIQIFYNNNGILNTAPGWSSADIMITNTVAFTDINKDNLATVSNLSYTGNGVRKTFNIPQRPVYSVDAVSVGGQQTMNYCYDNINGWVALGFAPQDGETVNISYKYFTKGDMAAVKWYNFESGIYFNNNGALNTIPGWTNGNSSTQRGAAWADFDKDGDMDLAIGGSDGPTVMYRNDNGIMTSSPAWSSAGSNTSAQEIMAADVNRDGYPDLAAIHFGYSRAEIFFNIGGVLETVPSWTYTTASSATSIAFGDVNGDGWLDLAVGTARKPIVLFIADPLLVPVEFGSFSASVNGDKVLLNWSTLSEKNNLGFAVERKGKGNWEELEFVMGKGTTAEVNYYSFSDMPSGSGKYQYRLRQTDYDGKVSYSSLTEVEYIANISFRLEQNYPNPFNPATRFEYALPQDGFVEIKLFDILGKEVKTLYSGNQVKGVHDLEIDANNLVSGVYIYRIRAGEYTASRKMVLLR